VILIAPLPHPARQVTQIQIHLLPLRDPALLPPPLLPPHRPPPPHRPRLIAPVGEKLPQKRNCRRRLREKKSLERNLPQDLVLTILFGKPPAPPRLAEVLVEAEARTEARARPQPQEMNEDQTDDHWIVEIETTRKMLDHQIVQKEEIPGMGRTEPFLSRELKTTQATIVAEIRDEKLKKVKIKEETEALLGMVPIVKGKDILTADLGIVWSRQESRESREKITIPEMGTGEVRIEIAARDRVEAAVRALDLMEMVEASTIKALQEGEMSEIVLNDIPPPSAGDLLQILAPIALTLEGVIRESAMSDSGPVSCRPSP
jgi:hypothetical protein